MCQPHSSEIPWYLGRSEDYVAVVVNDTNAFQHRVIRWYMLKLQAISGCTEEMPLGASVIAVRKYGLVQTCYREDRRHSSIRPAVFNSQHQVQSL